MCANRSIGREKHSRSEICLWKVSLIESSTVSSHLSGVFQRLWTVRRGGRRRGFKRPSGSYTLEKVLSMDLLDSFSFFTKIGTLIDNVSFSVFQARPRSF